MRYVDKGFNLHQKALKRQISQFYLFFIHPNVIKIE